jgi:NAD(P)H dehydrogenase (quinone)
MRVLVLYCHPVESSFNAAVHAEVVAGLREAGHTIDDCDLYAEGFQPVLTREERLGYHDIPANLGPVRGYVERVQAAEALVLVTPVWNFGWPAMLKGFFDRVFLPGVSFKLVDGKVRPNLTNIRKLAVVCTYGGARWRALVLRDPPRKNAFGWLKILMHPAASLDYLALYDMNRADDAKRRGFLQTVRAKMAAF